MRRKSMVANCRCICVWRCALHRLAACMLLLYRTQEPPSTLHSSPGPALSICMSAVQAIMTKEAQSRAGNAGYTLFEQVKHYHHPLLILHQFPVTVHLVVLQWLISDAHPEVLAFVVSPYSRGGISGEKLEDSRRLAT